MTDKKIVDVNTDNLDDFSALFHGKAAEAPVEQTENTDETPTDEIEDPNPLATEETDVTSEEGDDDDQADEDNSEDGEEDELEEVPLTKDSKEEKPKSRFQERINELTAKNRIEREEKEKLQKRIEELEAKFNQENKVTPKPVALEDEAPTPDDKLEDGTDKYPLGEFDPLYIRDLTRFTIKKENEAAKAALEQEKIKQEAEKQKLELYTNWAEKLEVAREKYEDLDEVNTTLEETFTDLDSNYAEYLIGTIMSLEYGPDVLYYLGQNLDEAQKIVSSGPTKATIALGRLEARFASENDNNTQPTKKIVKVSKAPTPPPVLNKGTKGRVNVPDDTDDLDAFEDKFYARKR